MAVFHGGCRQYWKAPKYVYISNQRMFSKRDGVTDVSVCFVANNHGISKHFDKHICRKHRVDLRLCTRGSCWVWLG